MLTPAKLHSMTPEDRTNMLTDLCTAVYGKPNPLKALAYDFGTETKTPFNWRKNHSTPFAVLLTLDAWSERKRLQLELRAMADDLDGGCDRDPSSDEPERSASPK